MKASLRFITRKSRGGISVRETEVESNTLRAGRGNDCEIHLTDPRVLLHHAEFSLRSGDLYAAPSPGADLRLNGALTQMTRVAVGDKLKIGPYEVALDENAGGARIVLSVELVQPLEDDLDDLV
ncbi:MAG: FHA domain-containing protein, partial [Rhodospirillaceae bacterium]|nr:FHA domain-containing protein [Rhodospirillaceae bacterium]